MNKPNIPAIFKGAKTFTSKHSPEILTIVGLGGMFFAIGSAIKATPKALKNIEAAKKEKGVDKLTPVETVKAAWKCYLPTAISCVTSSACLIGANTTLLKRNAALATAYKVTETALTEFREKVVEEIGEEKTHEIEDKATAAAVEKREISNKDATNTGEGIELYVDAFGGQPFRSCRSAIDKAVLKFENDLLRYDYCSLNDLYDYLGIDHSDVGDQVGWKCGTRVSARYSSCYKNGELCGIVRYDPRPEYGFDSSY